MMIAVALTMSAWSWLVDSSTPARLIRDNDQQLAGHQGPPREAPLLQPATNAGSEAGKMR